MATTGPSGEQVYATLLLSDSYLPGALVLAHSIRDAGTHHKLAVMVTLDSVSADSITQLKAVYDYVFPVPRIRNDHPANLYLMNRGDLHSAFTKINLWKLTQFSKIVYIDADIVAYRAPDELFDIPHAFSAAPDIGWPDLFNTGVMVLTPNVGDFYAMIAMAERGISFDGADQGLINMHFGNQYHRLSFTYNVTPSAHYQYVPAYRHFQSSINMVHFIGSSKPWFTGRDVPYGSDPFNEMVGRWNLLLKRHLLFPNMYSTSRRASGILNRQPMSSPLANIRALLLQGSLILRPRAMNIMRTMTRMIKGTNITHMILGITMNRTTITVSLARLPMSRIWSPMASQLPDLRVSIAQNTTHPSINITIKEHRRCSTMRSQDKNHHTSQCTAGTPKGRSNANYYSTPGAGITDAVRQPPPADSRPEAINFPSTHYEMSQDTTPFVPPERYPSPPKNMWYEVPKEPPASRSKRPAEIFPWERNRPPPTRTFAGEPEPPPPEAEPIVESRPEPTAESSAKTEALAESSGVASSTTETKSEASTPTTPTVQITPSDPWTSFPRVNAWDEVPEIERYVDGLRGHRRGKSSGSLGRIKSPSTSAWKDDRSGMQLRGLKLTDFPSAVERPSLPVTPAPVHRQSFWSGDDKEHGGDEGATQLPEAEGVPAQSDWDPLAQLQKLAKQQSDVLLKKLGGGDEGEGREGGAGGSAPGVLSPQPVKGKKAPSILRDMSSGGLEPMTTSKPPSIPEPSYSGPGAAWERGEAIPQRKTPLLPRDEDLDVLET
ncbi:hypothetical protein FDECE_1973 [Fusarium decemcellulare]|nr:hypothetical protein FDECE_1973 [Fusarium decemcellulare]